MRRIILTMAVSLFTVTAPLGPASAAHAAGIRHPLAAPTPGALARDAFQDHRAFLQLEATLALDAIAGRFNSTLSQFVAKWQRVAVCEVNGNWSMVGPYYSGIGFSNATWAQYGGTRWAPSAGQATRLQQILVGMKITKTWIPDQYGCSPIGW